MLDMIFFTPSLKFFRLLIFLRKLKAKPMASLRDNKKKKKKKLSPSRLTLLCLKPYRTITVLGQNFRIDSNFGPHDKRNTV